MIAATTRVAGRAAVALALLAAPTVALAESHGAESDVSADTVVATVGGQDITVGHMIVARTTLPRQFQQLPDAQLYPAVLDQLVRQYALAQSLPAPTRATELTIENQRSGLLAGEALGMVIADQLTDEAVEAAYAERYADAEPSREYEAAHILVASEEDAQAVIAELEGGADFAALARERSTGPSGPNGGMLGWLPLGATVAEFETAMVALETGEISGPVQSQFGWHVIRLNDTRLTEAPPLEEVEGEIRQELENEIVEAHIETVMETAGIVMPELDIDPSILSDLDLVAE
ncbi:MAG: peptidylprolyl isomerase [Pseudomonadota bacterium]